MSSPREQVVHEIGDGRFVAWDAPKAAPEVKRAFAKAIEDEREKSESLREELREARKSKSPRR
jgi:hypothetical protein